VQAVRLFQGYLWHPKEASLDPRALLPEEVLGARLLIDPVPPPTPFFEDGTPTATQAFYQVTLLLLTEEAPEALSPWPKGWRRPLGSTWRASPPGWAGSSWRT
jgi:hypothetical protein